MRRGYYVCAENWLGMFRAYFNFVLFDSQSRRRRYRYVPALVSLLKVGLSSLSQRSTFGKRFLRSQNKKKKTYLTFQTYITTTTTTQQPNEKEREIEELYYTQSLLLN